MYNVDKGVNAYSKKDNTDTSLEDFLSTQFQNW